MRARARRRRAGGFRCRPGPEGSQEEVEARQEPLLAALLLAGTAGMLLWGSVRTYLDDPAVEESSAPCWWPRSVGAMGVAVLVLVAIGLVPAVV